MSLFSAHRQDHDQTPLRSVAFSVAEAALESDPSSPSFNLSMADLMDAPPLEPDVAVWDDMVDMDAWPRAKHRAKSFAGRGQPLWQLVEHAKERREREKPSLLASDDTFMMMHSADSSPHLDSSAWLNLHLMGHSLPRLSALDFAAKAEKNAAASVAHARTQSDADRSPSEFNTPRLPSLAQIQAKMQRTGDRSQSHRSDSWDSVDSDGPETPTDEMVAFNLPFRRPMTPDSPQSSRLAPFLRERTNGRLTRPKSMPPLSGPPHTPERRERLKTIRQFSLPATPPTKKPTSRQMSLPATPGALSTLPPIVTPPRVVIAETPMSPTESVTSTASSTLPIITCTPAIEEDSDEESEGDVIVFSGDFDDDQDRSERETLGREMRDRLLQRQSS